MLLELLPFFIILKNSPRARLSFGDELLLQKNKIFISKKTRKTIFLAKNRWQFYLKKKPHKIGKNWMIKNYYWLKKDSTEDFSIFSVIFVRVCERVCVLPTQLRSFNLSRRCKYIAASLLLCPFSCCFLSSLWLFERSNNQEESRWGKAHHPHTSLGIKKSKMLLFAHHSPSM